jgi:hypothetical protein
MKKLAVLAFGVLFGVDSAFAIDTSEMSGEKKTACEVIMCLSSSAGRPGACKEPLKKYFELQATRHKSISSVRSDFLKKCPDGGSSGDEKYDSLKSTLKEQKFECTAEEFNKDTHAEKRSGGDGDGSSIRTMAEVPQFCKDLAKEEYSILELPTYIGNKQWYSTTDWGRGYELKKTTKAEYEQWLVEGNEGEIVTLDECYANGFSGCKEYYLHVPVVKISWADIDSSGSVISSYSSEASSSEDIDLNEAKKALNEVTNSADSKQAYQETVQKIEQEASNYQSNVDSVKNSAEYKNYSSSLDEFKNSAEYQNYGSSLESTKSSAEYQNYGSSLENTKNSAEYKNYNNSVAELKSSATYQSY